LVLFASDKQQTTPSLSGKVADAHLSDPLLEGRISLIS